MQMRLIELEEDWHRHDSGVIIGYYGEAKTLAVFVPTAPDAYKIITREKPEGEPITNEVARQIDKSAFECYAGFPARELKILDLMKFIFRQCWIADYKTVIAISLVSGLIPLAMPIVTETIFADIIPILDRQGLATVTQVIMVTSFTTASLGIVRTIAVMRITTRMNMATEAALWGRLLTLPTRFFRQFTSGELAARMGGISVIKGLVSADFIGGLFGFVFSFWSIFLMCYYSLKLTGVAIAVWLVYAIVTAFIYRRVIGFQRNLIAANNKEAGIVQQIFKGLAKFREHGAENQAFWLWSSVFGETWKWNLKLRWQSNYNAIIGSVQPFILTMCLYYIAVYGMNEVGANGQTVQGIGYAQFIAFQGAFSSFNATLNGIIPLVGQYFAIQPHIENLRPILKEVPESVGEKADAGILSGAIELSNVTFGYVEGRDVLHDVSIKISAGENVAIVGRSGCGKSTLVRLLLGFETPRKGAIYLYSEEMADAVALIDGRIENIFVNKNSSVHRGQVIFSLVNDDIPLKIKQADSSIARAEAQLANAKNNYARYSRLMERDATSREKFDEAQANFFAASAALQEAQTIREQLLVQSARQVVTAPIDGEILIIYRQLGSYVSAGTPIALVANFSTLFFSFPLDDTLAQQFHPGDRAELSFANTNILRKAYDTEFAPGNKGVGQVFWVKVRDILPPLSEPASLRKIVWQVDNRVGLLEQQAYSAATLTSSNTRKILAVPLASMLDSNRNSVFLASKDGILERRNVKTGADDGTFIEVISGLNDGETVITSAAEGLSAGMKVTVNLEGE